MYSTLPTQQSNSKGAPHESHAAGSRPTDRSIVLDPGKTATIGLGVYNLSEPMPSFVVESVPATQDMLGISLERLDIPGKSKYVAFYQFHNFGDKPICITVRRDNKNIARRQGPGV
ncbi:MAG TPA: hypothetical protein VJ836_04195 [Candidatus Saccharimonadales bacterium]|nr:hypothetical protein [Candidatus Saccharimonadales bacterium]